jgi:hypothetical protein
MKAHARYLLFVATILLTMVGCSKGGSDSASTPPPNPAAYGTSCGNGLINSQYGCQPSCGVNSVMYQNQCLPISNTGIGGQFGQQFPGQQQQYPGQVGGGAQMCSGMCGAGGVQIGGQSGQPQCLPQGTCGPCYGQYGPNCYIGDYAHQYYGY